MIDKLKEIGWTDYEARAYIALLQQNPANGYQIGRMSGISTSKIYETLRRLVARGAAVQQSTSNLEVTLYSPVPPEDLIAGMRAYKEKLFSELKQELDSFQPPSRSPASSLTLNGYAQVIGCAAGLLLRANQSVVMQMPDSYQDSLRNELALCSRRGVIIHRGSPDQKNGDTLRIWLLSTDDIETLLFSESGKEVEGMAITGKLLARLAQSYALRGKTFDALNPGIYRPVNWLDWEENKQRRLLPQLKH